MKALGVNIDRVTDSIDWQVDATPGTRAKAFTPEWTSWLIATVNAGIDLDLTIYAHRHMQVNYRNN